MRSAIIRSSLAAVAIGLFAAATMAPAQAQVEIARQQNLVATVPSGTWCAPNAPVTIHAPSRTSFREGDWALREIGGTIRRTMENVCPIATHVNIIGRVDGAEVFNGRLGPDTGNRIVGSYVDGSGTTVTSPSVSQPATGTTQMTDRDRVRRAQGMLNQLGYSAGPVDGIIGPRTREAVRSFQRAHGLPVDGRVTQDLISALISAQG
jgi:hypothetical protein